MCLKKVGFYVLCSLALPIVKTSAQQNLALDDYTCEQFLQDSKSPADGSKLLKSLMMISWATGYATAFQKNTPRADAEAIILMAATIGSACRNAPGKNVVEIVVEAVNQFTSVANGPATPGPSTTANKPVPTPDGNFKAYANFDLPQGDLHHLQRVELSKCKAACETDRKCKAYSYDKWNKWCFLKSKATALTLEPGSISAIRTGSQEPPESNAEIRIESRTASTLEGSHHGVKSGSVQECALSCLKDDNCLGYTFATTSKQCNLFSDIVTLSPDTSTISGFKTQTAP